MPIMIPMIIPMSSRTTPRSSTELARSSLVSSDPERELAEIPDRILGTIRIMATAGRMTIANPAISNREPVLGDANLVDDLERTLNPR